MRIVLSLFVVFLAAKPASASPLLVNGGFELGPSLNGTHDLDVLAGSTDIAGWTVFGDSIEYLGPPWQVAEGLHALDLDGHNTVLSGVQQTFPTVAGTGYVVSFAMSGNGDGGSLIKMLEASVGDVVLDFAFDTTGYVHEAPLWQTLTFGFVALDPWSTLTFRSLSAAPSSYGPLLDDVVVAPVPEPSSIGLLVSGLVGLWVRRRRGGSRSGLQR